MLEIISRPLLRRRAVRYVRANPEAVLVVQATLEAFDLKVRNAREAAELAVGHSFSDDDWKRVAESWERVWRGIRWRWSRCWRADKA